MTKRIYTPLAEKQIKGLKAGGRVLLSGIVYTARDQAHRELVCAIERKRKLPIYLRSQVIYYCGPTPALPGRPIGSCGPTTSSRLDDFTVTLLKAGLKGMIGKGKRSPGIRAAIKKYGAVYFLALGGAGALLSTKVKRAAVVAYKQFGPEAIYKLTVQDFPLIVGIDSRGRDIYAR